MNNSLRIVLSVALAFLSAAAKAQQFDWVHGGGTNFNLQSPNYREATYYMCTDANKNVYALSEVGYGAITADTFYKSAGYGSGQNWLISSYTCDGQMRWAKFIGSNSGDCIPAGIVNDSLGHIYVGGYVTNNTLHIGSNISITGLQNEHLAVMQFDTLGNYNWVKYVGNNTAATNAGSGYNNNLIMGANNQVHFLCDMGSNVVVTPSVTTQFGVYDIVYDQTGSQLSATRLGMDSIWYIHYAALDNVNGKLYVIGERDMNVIPAFRSFAAALDANRNLIWLDTVGDQAGFSGIAYDNMGHLYFSGSSNLAQFIFNGITGPNGNVGVILKTDTTGKPIWMQSTRILANGTNGYPPHTLTLLPNNLIAAAGSFGTSITNGIDTITCPQQGNNPFLSIVDTSGIPMSLKQIYGDGYYDWSTGITSDRVGNVYIGGQVEDSVWAQNPTIPAYHSHGGNTDFFVMKYGVDCGCTSMPVANFSVAGADTAHTKNLTYNGTTNGIDSVRWYFGYPATDTASGTTTNHTFDTGYTWVCVEVFSPCGNDLHCMRIHVTPPEGVNNVPFQSLNALVYPNPVKDELKIVTNVRGSYKLMNVSGTTIQKGALNSAQTILATKNLSAGIYLLEIVAESGQTEVVKVIKE